MCRGVHFGLSVWIQVWPNKIIKVDKSKKASSTKGLCNIKLEGLLGSGERASDRAINPADGTSIFLALLV